jgi:hypothetical protein
VADFVDFLQVGDGDLGVNAGRVELAVAKKLQDQLDVGAAFYSSPRQDYGFLKNWQ